MIFGPVWGVIYNLGGALIGSTLAFVIARYLASDWVAEHAEGKLKAIKYGIEKEGWRFVALVRLVPLFPFNLSNYAFGLTKIKLLHYVLASAIFMIPATTAYTYLGSLGLEVIHGNGKHVVTKGLFVLGLFALLSVLPRFLKKTTGKNSHD